MGAGKEEEQKNNFVDSVDLFHFQIFETFWNSVTDFSINLSKYVGTVDNIFTENLHCYYTTHISWHVSIAT